MCISDHKTHDTIMVYSFLKHFYKHYITNKFPFLHRLYFSDGSVAQYKNFKILTNLIFHQIDLHIQAEWNFFLPHCMERMLATQLVALSKKPAVHANLQYPFSNQILTPKQLFNFAEANADGITSFFLSPEEAVGNNKFLQLRFATSSTFKGTQNNQQFIPNASSLSLTIKKTSFAILKALQILIGYFIMTLFYIFKQS